MTSSIVGNPFFFLKNWVDDGIEYFEIDSTPTIDVSELKAAYFEKLEPGYPLPWNHPADLPCDAVKGILPSGRPFFAVRYVDEKTNRLALEFFFQVFPDQSMLWRTTEHLCVTNPINVSRIDPDVSHANIRVLGHLLRGSPLEETGGRYLPSFAFLYQKSALPLTSYAPDDGGHFALRARLIAEEKN